MSLTMQLEIVSSTETAFKASIKELYIPAFNGRAGILENHKPYISLLQQGEMSFTDIQGKKFFFFIRDGFVEVKGNKIVIISDAIEKAETLNKAEIDAKISALEQTILNLQKKEMSPQELLDAPEKITQALQSKHEFESKRAIIKEFEALK